MSICSQVPHCVPVASFSSSILSSKDHPTLLIGALQLVELLLSKIPQEYRPAFRWEGAFHEVDLLTVTSIHVLEVSYTFVTNAFITNYKLIQNVLL